MRDKDRNIEAAKNRRYRKWFRNIDAKEYRRYRKWFRDMNENKMKDIMAHRYARFRYIYHFSDQSYLFKLIFLLDVLDVDFE